MEFAKSSPFTGRGTMCSMVEGVRLLSRCRVSVVTPSVSASHCHLPMNGEEL